MYDKAVEKCPFVSDAAHEMFDEIVSEDSFKLNYDHDNTLHFNGDSGNAVYFCNEMGIASIDLNNINLIILTMIKMILKLLFTSDFWCGIVNLKNTKHLKKS